MVKGINNVIRIPTSLETGFFRLWMEFLSPLHGLTGREKDVVASFLKVRHRLSKSISDDKLIEAALTTPDVIDDIRADCGVSMPFFRVIMGSLRQKDVFRGNRLNPKYIPSGVKTGMKDFKLVLYFDISEDTVKEEGVKDEKG